jgi:hypothetical protein
VKVNVVCRNHPSDRVLPRFARHLAQFNGWALSTEAAPGYDINLYMAYFEHQKNTRFNGRVAAYFTHYEQGAKGALYDQVAQLARLRIAMNEGQLKHLRKFGKAEVVPLPLETDRFTLKRASVGKVPILGFSGYSYASGRKGETLAERLVKQVSGVTFTASGRGWPCKTKMYAWSQMPAFFQGLDLFVCTSTIEGGPMTTLEALSCGVPVVIPNSVGIHPQIPETFGVYRYPTGDYNGLLQATRQALGDMGKHNREELRHATRPHSVAAFCDGMRTLLEGETRMKTRAVEAPATLPPYQGNSGIYVVAFGDPARTEAVKCIKSFHKYMPDIPVALCSDRKLGPENVLIIQPDKDIGGRIAKLRAYDLAPRNWKYVLYVDADTECIADVSFFFQLMADGWEFAICKDAHLHDTMKDFQRRNNTVEFDKTIAELGTDESLQINGGVWAFRRCAATKRFFARWLEEWNVFKGRDQGAFIRALYRDPLRVYWLGNEWNTLITLKGHEYPPGRKGSAGILHHVGTARRWEGQVPTGKGLTDPEAWDMVKRWTAKHGKGRR